MDGTNSMGQDALSSTTKNKLDSPPDAESNPPNTLAEAEFPEMGAVFIAYLILLFILYGFLSFISPWFLSELWDNPVGTLGILTFGFVMLVGLVRFNGSFSRSSFVEIDRKARGESIPAIRTLSASTLRSVIRNVYATAPPMSSKVVDELVARASSHQKPGGDKHSDEGPLGTPFELYISKVVESLDKHISLTEEKGSNLLDRGLLFLSGGIVFYVAAIAVWQVWAKYGEPKDSIMYIGMFASSVVFLVCEFLAAWFLKQYRHYVDASLACLRVKSVYDRYLLSYYAIKESGAEAGGVSEKLNRMLETIKEDVMWPGHKENLSNDFNYMLESMTSVHASLDKFKGLFEASAKSGKSKP
jgi:hypothetical protein